MRYRGYGNYDKYPTTKIEGYQAFSGESEIIAELKNKLQGKQNAVLVVDCYPNIETEEIISLFSLLNPELMLWSDECAISEGEYINAIEDYLTDDRVFGYLCPKNIEIFFSEREIEHAQEKIKATKGLTVVYGVGASLIHKGDICIYADLARWEIQTRYKEGASNWNTNNENAPFLSKYKQGYFVEWRFADRHKQKVWKHMDYVLDTNFKANPKMVSADGFFDGLLQVAKKPFRVVPYFDPGVWGGQWMKEICGLDCFVENYAWSFDGVPEENSLYLQYGDVRMEIPSIDLVLYAPRQLLGERVHGRYGAEFPIRFDFLDTIEGQNLSLQVHPLTEYIQKTFGMHYTQDESYYILDTEPNKEVNVYLGLKKNIDKEAMLRDLKRAQAGEISFPADLYINKIPAKKHDHFLIPAGTVHCSGSGAMVLEISATPYIFTFKLWDWDRLGLDGLPRPIHIEHGEQVIQWDRDTDYVMEQLVNHFEILSEDDSCVVTKTGLHEREPIETVTHRSKEKMIHYTNGSVNMLNLVEGAEAIIESPSNSFQPFVVHYAETFIIPAQVGEYTITPYGQANGKEIMTIKAYIR